MVIVRTIRISYGALMNPVHLKTFLVVGKHLNYTRAAEELMISQPTVSRQIKQLEDQLQTRLFELLGKSLHYTAAGQTLAKEATKALGVLDRLTESVRAHNCAKSGILRIGASTTPGLYLLPTILSDYLEQYPRVDFSYAVENSRVIEKQLLRNDLDIGFVGFPLQNAAIIERPLLTDEIICIASPEHPLAQKKNVSVEELSQQTWIVREAGSATRSLFEEWFQAQGGSWGKVISLANPEPVKRLVAANLGLSFLSHFAARDELTSGRLRRVDVRGLELKRQLLLAQHVDKLVTPVMEGFLDMVFKAFPRPERNSRNGLAKSNGHLIRARSDKQVDQSVLNQSTKC